MIALLFFVIGILVGIVLNRAADNLPPPLRRSLLVTPACPHCDTPLPFVRQSGLAAFVLRRDRCANCGARRSLRAPLTEIASGALFAFLAARFPLSPYLIAVCFFAAVLLLIAVIDIEHKLILNVVVLPATMLALLVSPLLLGGAYMAPGTLRLNLYLISLLGMAVGFAVTLVIYFLGFAFLNLINRGRRNKINTVAFGLGDVKLAGLLGALIGFPAIFYALIYAILLGGVGALAAILWRMLRREKYSAFSAMPYGPYLILAGGAFLIFGPELLGWILGP